MPTAFALRRRRHFHPDSDNRPTVPDDMMFWHGELRPIETVERHSRLRMGDWDKLPQALRIHLRDQPNEPNLLITTKLNEALASGKLLDASGKPVRSARKAFKPTLDDI